MAIDIMQKTWIIFQNKVHYFLQKDAFVLILGWNMNVFSQWLSDQKTQMEVRLYGNYVVRNLDSQKY